MRAVVRNAYGPPAEVLRLEHLPTPTPDAEEMLIRIRAASINLGDWELLTGQPRFIAIIAHIFTREQRYAFPPDSVAGGARRRFAPKSRILGTDLAGVVEAVGSKVTRFRPGDEVFGMAERFGAFAEYACVPEAAPMASKPPGLSFEQAAALPQATHIALQAMRDRGRVQPGHKVLVNGAGGGAGTLAVQLAKIYGAEVTGVDGPTKLEMLHNIGADYVIDYTRENYLERGERYDVILDMAAHRSIFESRRALTPSGIYLMAGGGGTATWQAAFLAPLASLTGNGKMKFLLAASRPRDLDDMAGLVLAGKLTPVIDRAYRLEDAGEALQRVGDKQGIGKVLIIP